MLLAVSCASKPWATPSLPVSKHCCWYPPQELTRRFTRQLHELALTIRGHRSFLRVSFTSSCLVLRQWFQHSPIGSDIPILLLEVSKRRKDQVSLPIARLVSTLVRKQDTCANLLSHVPESELPNFFAFTNLVKPSVSAMDTAPICIEPAQSPCEKPVLPT